MRTTATYTSPSGVAHTRVLDLNTRALPDSTMMDLGAMGLKSLVFNWQDGSKTEYSAPEYECEWCGEYGHGTVESCPNFNEETEGFDGWPE